jgi:diguanylate cyclase (GGDEF)-like protein
MEVPVNQKQISSDDRIKIKRQLHEDIVQHLYQGSMPGAITGILASVALFLDFYKYTPTHLLIGWLVIFNIMMLSLIFLYLFYLQYKDNFELATWERVFSITMCGCAISWLPCILLIPTDLERQFLGLIALFLATTGYSIGTIGQFRLCVTTLIIILFPIAIWGIVKGGLFYYIIGAYSLIYMFFLIGANHRSTNWFKQALQLKIENTLVSYQVNHDILTDLPNQRLLPQYVNFSIQKIKNTNKIFCLVCFSLNRLENITDSLGHGASDAIVQSVGNRLQILATQMTKIKNGPQYFITISRKDTFIILIVPVAATEIQNRVEILFRIFDTPFYLHEKGIKLSASAGISIYGKDGSDMDSLLVSAEAAMLQAKQFGGNHLEFYRTEINAQLPKKLEIENDLYDALKNNELAVYYQPLIDIKANKIAGMEALIRWKHPKHGFISPMQFIPIAEETGLIIPIGEWVTTQACQQTRIWHDQGFSTLKVAVNLSDKQLRNKKIITSIQEILKNTKLEKAFLELEITETAILDEVVIPIIQEFKNMGLSIAVDDFGTGYSGLSYLKRFSIDKLKIDQSFIKDIPQSSDSIAIVSAIIAIGKELGVKILAEGVETIQQLNFLKSKECDYVQGYYFSKPLDTNLFTQLLLNDKNLLAQPASKENK